MKRIFILLIAVMLTFSCSNKELVVSWEGNNLRISKGKTKALFSKDKETIEMYRVLEMKKEIEPAFDFASAKLFGIPLQIVPDNRSLTQEDLQNTKCIYLLAFDKTTRLKIDKATDKNNCWKKIKITGTIMIPKEIILGKDNVTNVPGTFIKVKDVADVP